ncbi:MAG: hypothetical protein AAGN66_18765 [Acidobacteriota bacterium]
MISTRDLSGLPDIDTLLHQHQNLATLDAILCPEWEFRYFTFDNNWDPGEKLGWMRNGEGDDWLALFNESGAILKGYAHDAPMADGAPWEGLFEDVPPAFESFLKEPSFSINKSTFCCWRLRDDDAWSRSQIAFPSDPDPDGSGRMLYFLDGDPRTYKRWGDEYFGAPLDLGAVSSIYRREPMSAALVRALNPDAAFSDVREAAVAIGYPVA